MYTIQLIYYSNVIAYLKENFTDKTSERTLIFYSKVLKHPLFTIKLKIILNEQEIIIPE